MLTSILNGISEVLNAIPTISFSTTANSDTVEGIFEVTREPIQATGEAWSDDADAVAS